MSPLLPAFHQSNVNEKLLQHTDILPPPTQDYPASQNKWSRGDCDTSQITNNKAEKKKMDSNYKCMSNSIDLKMIIKQISLR